ncbi:NfeD family protein [Mameliella sediminis]|uniref:NfeD family protein n=1 Tax=Mameliella sediminis TaxID=2836866 RepID=UPI001C45E4B4|nr:hypothetical protein [Mameliella sediminis]MBY6117416.1 hypothetical protein [Antarctobacter heliothermus]MBY6147273.1 hypothetical protein [Mameliella alba]MBV7397443.1 hypothetical protein [Mameliella sediminis]MBY6164137.1 hypothetical protein [Mameliella alba]MBY6172644.1 hypothetical protein [Mameliella alba]
MGLGWNVWWVWMAGGIALAILELLAPGFIFLGFAIGALAMGLLFLLTGGTMLGGSLPLTLLTFAILSLVAWFALRQAMGVRKGQTRIWDRDINED